MVQSFLGRAFLCAVFVFLGVSASFATEAQEPRVEVNTYPSWVRVQDYDPASLDGKPTNGPAYLLISRQRFHGDRDEDYYTRYVTKITAIGDAEDASQISISFDPTYERLTFHHMRVVRDGVVQDRLDLSEFELLRQESEADRLIFNGDVTASTILKDIRVGDIVDYAFTIHGKNPVFYGHISDRVDLNYSVPVGKYFVSFDLPDDRSYQMGAYGDALEPEIEQVAGRKRLTWDQTQLPGRRMDDDRPQWHRAYGMFEITDQASWEALGQLYAPFYTVPETISPELAAEIERIAAAHTTPEARVKAALSFVQRNVRYLAINVGKGGYAPRDPSVVFDQRFGDCKDKSILLVTILERMGIKAAPLLVDTNIHAQFRRELPSAYTFDHVITQVTLGDKIYWLDPTQNDQTGDLAHMQQPDYGAGLLIAKTDAGLAEFPGQETPSNVHVVDTFDTVAEPDAILFTARSVYWGNRADGVLRTIANKGVEGLQQNYLEYYQANYPSIVVKDPIKVARDDVTGTVTVTESYRIPDAWTVDEDDGEMRFPAWPSEVSGLLPEADLAPRTTPLDLAWPSKAEHELRFIVDEDWSFDDEDISLDNAVFSYSKVARFKGTVYSEKYSYVGKKDYADPEDLKQFNADAERADDEDGVQLYQPGPEVLSAEDQNIEEIIEYIAYGLVAALFVFIIFVFVKAVTVDADWRTEALYYPISLTKFITLSMATFGAYAFFWSFKNWQWVRDGEGKDIWPFWRAIFSVFTNFSLFSRIADAGPNGGNKLLQTLFAPAALVILVNEGISNAADRTDVLPDWIFFVFIISMLVMVPFVRHTNKINEENPTVLARNSAFTWHSWVAVAIGVLAWPFVILGAFFVD